MLSRTLRAVSVLLLTTTLALTGTDVASAARPHPAATPEPARSSVAVGVDTLDLHGDGVIPHRNGRAARVQTWKVSTLYYYETLPAKWDWSLSTAVAKWNGSGARIRLVRTTIPRKAQVRIGYANIGSAAGLATVGATRNAFVHLSSRFSGWDAVNARNRVTIMNVLAHELGHVFGFQHTAGRCTLMAPVIDVDACGTVPSSQPGYYKCRTIDTALVARFVKVYGGRARYASAGSCLIDPLPPVLGGVTISGGTSAPVTVRWTPPKSLPSGSTLVIRRWETATCGTAPAWADTFRPAARSGVWRDAEADEAEANCFQIRLLNRYGAGRPPQHKVLSRWVPAVVAPVIGTPSHDSDTDEFTFAATVPAGATLHARWDSTDPSTCVTAPTGGNNSSFVPVVGGYGTLSLGTEPQCVSFFAYDQDRHRYSQAVSVVFELPAPPTIGALTLEPGFYPLWTASVSDVPAGGTAAHATLAGPCPATVPDGVVWDTRTRSDLNLTSSGPTAGDAVLVSRAEGDNCALFTTLDWLGAQSLDNGTTSTGRHGPVVMRDFMDEGPLPPTVGAPVWNAGAGSFEIPVSDTRRLHVIYDPSDPTTCPPSDLPGTQSVDFQVSLDNRIHVVPPVPHTCVTIYTDASEGPVRLSAGVPADLVVPQG
ncbi:MAG: matrixin family metalloprotease [Marmoricola sp.]